MRIKTSELTGAALDWAVAKCECAVRGVSEGYLLPAVFAKHHDEHDFNYSKKWAQGGPIIEREGVSMACAPKDARGRWRAVLGPNRFLSPDYEGFGTTPLVAAMRCYVASKLGDEVELPEGL